MNFPSLSHPEPLIRVKAKDRLAVAIRVLDVNMLIGRASAQQIEMMKVNDLLDAAEANFSEIIGSIHYNSDLQTLRQPN